MLAADAAPALGSVANLALLSLGLVVLYAVLARITATDSLPCELQWVGECPNKLFARAKARFASLSKVRELLNEGYEKVSSFCQVQL